MTKQASGSMAAPHAGGGMRFLGAGTVPKPRDGGTASPVRVVELLPYGSGDFDGQLVNVLDAQPGRGPVVGFGVRSPDEPARWPWSKGWRPAELDWTATDVQKNREVSLGANRADGYVTGCSGRTVQFGLARGRGRTAETPRRHGH